MNALARVTIFEPTSIELEAMRRRASFRAAIARRAAALATRLSGPEATRPSPHLASFYPPPHIPSAYYDSDGWRGDGPPPRLSVKTIQRVVAEHHEMTIDALLAPRRLGPTVRARQIAFYLCRELTRKSMPDLGRKFGGYDHTTVLHACRRMDAAIRADWRMAHDVYLLMRKLGWRP